MPIKTSKLNILDFTGQQLGGWLDEHDIAGYRGGQIMKWLYHRQVDSFDRMTDLSMAVRALLPQYFDIPRLVSETVETSKDGTRKFLFRLQDTNAVESVLIPEKDHYTLCISSQVGCAQNCGFCLTAKTGFRRNLSCGEIVAQVRDIIHGLAGEKQLTNIVFMGMGEPLANYDNLVAALEILTDKARGLGFAHRRITVSTAGLIPKLASLGRDTKVNLAVSLNATDNKVRSELMPINRKYSLEDLLEACRRYPLAPGRRITFEYILIKEVNDSLEDAHRLAKLLRPIRSKINLIPFNSHQGCEYERPAESVILAFQETLINKYNYTVMVRRSKGEDISAACGQLMARNV